MIFQEVTNYLSRTVLDSREVQTSYIMSSTAAYQIEMTIAFASGLFFKRVSFFIYVF